MNKQFLQDLITQMEAMQFYWDGDNTGFAEDNFKVAQEVIEHAQTIISLLEQIK